MKDKFNKYCAEVMGYQIQKRTDIMDNVFFLYGGMNYNPYDDLNQMADVVEKLASKWGVDEQICSDWVFAQEQMEVVGIKQAFRDFIISTMEKDNES